MQRSEHWPDITAHREYWERHNNPHVYEYDPTDDGPEAEIGVAIRVSHLSNLHDEREEYLLISEIIDDLAIDIRLNNFLMRDRLRLRGVQI